MLIDRKQWSLRKPEWTGKIPAGERFFILALNIERSQKTQETLPLTHRMKKTRDNYCCRFRCDWIRPGKTYCPVGRHQNRGSMGYIIKSLRLPVCVCRLKGVCARCASMLCHTRLGVCARLDKDTNTLMHTHTHTHTLALTDPSSRYVRVCMCVCVFVHVFVHVCVYWEC